MSPAQTSVPLKSHTNRGCFWTQDPISSPQDNTSDHLIAFHKSKTGANCSPGIIERWGEAKAINLRGSDVPVPSAADRFYSPTEENPKGSGSPLCFSCSLLSGSSAAQLFSFASVPGDQEQEASEKLQQLQAASGLSSQERQEGAATFTDSTASHTLTAQQLTCPPAAHHPCSNCPFLRDSPSFSGPRAHLAPAHSASPSPALSCGKICSWTQSHTALEEQPQSSVSNAHTRSCHVNVCANPGSTTHRPVPLTAPEANTHQGSPRRLFPPHLFVETSDKASCSAPLAG